MDASLGENAALPDQGMYPAASNIRPIQSYIFEYTVTWPAIQVVRLGGVNMFDASVFPGLKTGP